MQNLHFIFALDVNARFVHLFLPDRVELTRREQQIVTLICRDMSSAEIAKELKVKASTIETHRQNIRQKLGVKGNAGVVLYGVRHGLVD